VCALKYSSANANSFMAPSSTKTHTNTISAALKNSGFEWPQSASTPMMIYRKGARGEGRTRVTWVCVSIALENDRVHGGGLCREVARTPFKITRNMTVNRPTEPSVMVAIFHCHHLKGVSAAFGSLSMNICTCRTRAVVMGEGWQGM
jgi:hypothetical protein